MELQLTSKPALPSDRSFGLTFAAVFALLAGWLVYKGNAYWMTCLGASAAFALVAVVFARVLHPLNVAWMWFGGLLNKIVSPIVLGIIFFVVFAPVGLLFRLRGRDLLNRKFDASAPSYWLHRTPPGPDAERSFPHQF
jgi:Saxitoxin biosynthesis operon protein SxtJ